MRESVIEEHFVKRVKAAGGLVRKVKWIGMRNAPDRVAMFPARKLCSGLDCAWCQPKGRAIWVELKRPEKGAEEAQAREHERMREFGQEVIVLNTIEAVDAFMEGL